MREGGTALEGNITAHTMVERPTFESDHLATTLYNSTAPVGGRTHATWEVWLGKHEHTQTRGSVRAATSVKLSPYTPGLGIYDGIERQ